MGNEFRQFGKELGMRHVVCPIFDHRGNGKIERLVRTINERLRANPEVLTEKQNKLFYQLMSALRTNKGKNGKSSFERHTGRKPNTVTSIIVKLYKELNDLEFDRTVDLEKLEEFPRDDDSTIFVRNRQRKENWQDFSKSEGVKSLAKPATPSNSCQPKRPMRLFYPKEKWPEEKRRRENNKNPRKPKIM